MNAQQFNEEYSIGQLVELENDFGKKEKTYTTSIAWELGHGEPVVKLAGKTGGYSLDRVTPITNQQQEDIEAIKDILQKIITHSDCEDFFDEDDLGNQIFAGTTINVDICYIEQLLLAANMESVGTIIEEHRKITEADHPIIF